MPPSENPETEAEFTADAELALGDVRPAELTLEQVLLGKVLATLREIRVILQRAADDAART